MHIKIQLQHRSTDIFVIENAQPKSRTEDVARENYWADSLEILHGHTYVEDMRSYRGVLGNSIWGVSYGVPLNTPRGPKNFKIFFSKISLFVHGIMYLDVQTISNMG